MKYYISNQQELNREVYSLDVLKLNNTLPIYMDGENDGLDAYTLIPILLGILQGDDYYVINLLTYSKEEIYKALLPYQDAEWVAHNMKYDWKVLKQQYNIYLKNVYCTQVNSQILYNGMDISHSYDSLVERHFKIKVDKAERNSFINRDNSKPITESEIQYLHKDLEYLPRLHEFQLKKLKDWQLENCSKLENKFLPCLGLIELNGVKLDVNKWKGLNLQFRTKREQIKKDIYNYLMELEKKFPKLFLSEVSNKQKKHIPNQLSLFSDEVENERTIKKELVISKINIDSSTQIKILLDRMGVEIDSSSEGTLSQFAINNQDHVANKFINLLLEYREYAKLISTYGDNFLQYVNPVTGLTHPNYFQNFTDTGRLSSNNYNIQNIPAKDEIRACFIPDSNNYLFADFDLSGQEISIAASYSQDPMLLKSLNEDMDLHSYLAQQTYRIITGNKDLIVSKAENKEYRNNHKPILFGCLYGAGFKRIAQVLNIDEELAKKVYNNLKKALPHLFAYQETVKKAAIKELQIRDGSRFNRLKRFNTGYGKVLESYQIEKQASNYPIQSSGASMVKLAIIKITNYIKDNKLDWQIKFTVHDKQPCCA